MRAWGIVIAFVFLGILALSYQHLGNQVNTLTNELADTTRVLSRFRTSNGSLTSKNVTLTIDNANLGKDNSDLKAKADRAKAESLLASTRLTETNQALRTTNQSLSAVKAKQAADQTVGGVGVVATTESDSVANREIATLKAIIINYETNVIPGLQRALSELTDEKYALENDLNGKGGARAEVGKLQKQIADARSFVQTKRAEAKGLFSKKRNRVLGEVDAQLQVAQKP